MSENGFDCVLININILLLVYYLPQYIVFRVLSNRKNLVPFLTTRWLNMKCPFCNSNEHKVLDKRESKAGNSIRRRRECLSCGRRFTTFERIDLGNIMVVKRDGSRQPFNRDKIKNGILKSLQKRPISTQQIDLMMDSIESTVRTKYEKDVCSKEIGNLIMQELRLIDPVAYIRFASVYKDFRNIREFINEIHGLQCDEGMSENEQS